MSKRNDETPSRRASGALTEAIEVERERLEGLERDQRAQIAAIRKLNEQKEREVAALHERQILALESALSPHVDVLSNNNLRSVVEQGHPGHTILEITFSPSGTETEILIMAFVMTGDPGADGREEVSLVPTPSIQSEPSNPTGRVLTLPKLGRPRGNSGSLSHYLFVRNKRGEQVIWGGNVYGLNDFPVSQSRTLEGAITEYLAKTVAGFQVNHEELRHDFGIYGSFSESLRDKSLPGLIFGVAFSSLAAWGLVALGSGSLASMALSGVIGALFFWWGFWANVRRSVGVLIPLFALLCLLVYLNLNV